MLLQEEKTEEKTADEDKGISWPLNGAQMSVAHLNRLFVQLAALRSLPGQSLSPLLSINHPELEAEIHSRRLCGHCWQTVAPRPQIRLARVARAIRPLF